MDLFGENIKQRTRFFLSFPLAYYVILRCGTGGCGVAERWGEQSRRTARPTGTTRCQRVAVGYLTIITNPRFTIRPVPSAETDTFHRFVRFVGVGTPVTVSV